MWRRVVALSVILAAGTMLPAHAASPTVRALESRVFVSAEAVPHRYGAPGTGESGTLPGFGIGASVLVPRDGWDAYAALTFYRAAGTLSTSGPALAGGKDQAATNSAEVRLGLGLPLAGGVEAIPYLAAGYQSWNHAVTAPGTPDIGETYHSGVFGIGARIDVPLTSSLAAYGGGEFLVLAGGGVSLPQGGTGVTPQERLELGVDQALPGPLHLFAQTFWSRYTASGTMPATSGAYNPFGTTTEEGVTLGLGYSF